MRKTHMGCSHIAAKERPQNLGFRGEPATFLPEAATKPISFRTYTPSREVWEYANHCQASRRKKGAFRKARDKQAMRERVALDKEVQQRVCQRLFGTLPQQQASKVTLDRVKEGLRSENCFLVKGRFRLPSDERGISRLVQLLGDHVRDGEAISLAHRFLNAGLAEYYRPNASYGNSKLPLTDALTEFWASCLGAALVRRGLDYASCGGEFIIFCTSRRAQKRVSSRLSALCRREFFCAGDAFEPVTCDVVDFAGYRVCASGIELGDVTLHQFKDEACHVTNRSNGWSNKRRKKALRSFSRRWSNVVGKTSNAVAFAHEADEWLSVRIRAVFWTQWKCVRTRHRCLVGLGIDKATARWLSCSRSGSHAIAKGGILTAALNARILHGRGFYFLGDYVK